MIQIIVMIVIAYAIIAFVMIEKGMFDIKQTNPVQDTIHWMPLLAQGALWPILVIMWFTSSILNESFWKDYVSHDQRMERIVDEMLREIESEMKIEDASYHTPSPRQYREMGNSAFHLTVTSIDGDF